MEARTNSAGDSLLALASTAARADTNWVGPVEAVHIARDRVVSLAVAGIVPVAAGTSPGDIDRTATREAIRTTAVEADHTATVEPDPVVVVRTVVVAIHITTDIVVGIVLVVVSTKSGADQAGHTALAEEDVRTTAGVASAVDTGLGLQAAE